MKKGLLELKRSSKARENSWPARFHSQRRPLWKWPLVTKQNSPLWNRHFAAKLFRRPKKPLRKCHFVVKSFRSPMPPSTKVFAAAKPPLGTWVLFCSLLPSFCSCEMAVKSPKRETPLWHTSAISQHTLLISQLRNRLRNGLRKWPSAAKMALRYENAPSLWNRPSSTKIKTTLGINSFFNGINSIFLINRSFELQTGAREEPNQSILPSSPSYLSFSRVCLRPSPSISHGKNPRS